MFKPAMSRPTTMVPPTRQQLDELDALLERMLALPVNQLEDDPETAARVHCQVPTLPAEYVLAPVEHMEPIASARPEPDEGPAVVEPLITVGQPMSASATRATVPPLTEESEPIIKIRKPSLPDRSESEGRAPSAAITPRKHGQRRWPRPLLWSNRAFDYCAERLGAPGRWLCRPGGRTLLGWTGLLCMAVALTIFVLDWIGWTW